MESNKMCLQRKTDRKKIGNLFYVKCYLFGSTQEKKLL